MVRVAPAAALRHGFWFAAGAICGVIAYVGEPLAFMLAVLLFVAATVVTASRRASLALPVYLVGAGLAGIALGIAISPQATYSFGTTGHSAVCSSAGGCVGGTVTQSSFAIPALAVFTTILVVGVL